jgi:hypothetical protein
MTPFLRQNAVGPRVEDISQECWPSRVFDRREVSTPLELVVVSDDRREPIALARRRRCMHRTVIVYAAQTAWNPSTEGYAAARLRCCRCVEHRVDPLPSRLTKATLLQDGVERGII